MTTYLIVLFFIAMVVDMAYSTYDYITNGRLTWRFIIHFLFVLLVVERVFL